MNDDKLHIAGATLYYKNRPLFNELNFSIELGKTTCLLGPSGVGKSSLLEWMLNLHELKNNVSYMPQEHCLFPWLNALDNVTVSERLKKQKPDNQQAIEILSRLGIHDPKQKIQELSGGMKQRVAIARVIYENKPFILMDEPFSALDAITRYQIQDIITEHFKDKTVLLITHDPLEALRLGDTLLIMQGQPATVKKFSDITLDKPRNMHKPECQTLHADLLEQLSQAKAAEC